jgi:pyruvate kinase
MTKFMMTEQSAREDADQKKLRELYDNCLSLRQTLIDQSKSILDGWRHFKILNFEWVDATNMAHYLVLRRQDLSDLQLSLSACGLSSLGRSEAKVLVSLDALLVTLAKLNCQKALPYPSFDQALSGQRSIQELCNNIFGFSQEAPRTRIMVTLPSEAADSPELVDQLIHAGMDCARINCAHDDAQSWDKMISHIRASEEKYTRSCHVMMDIAGPKCRITKIQCQKDFRLTRKARFFLIKSSKELDQYRVAITINFPHIIDQLEIGAEISIDDGKARGVVITKVDAGVEIEITNAIAKGLKLRTERGLNFPTTALVLPPLTPKDFEDLDFIAQHADMVGFSFVQRTADIELLQEHLSVRRGTLKPQTLILKIETPLAVQNLPELILQSATQNPTGVMIARGDLAVELGFARLSEMQEEILWLCESAHIPVIWATEVLSNFIKEGVMSRAEATDAAMSQRADCVMINKGPYAVEAICFLADILKRMDRHHTKKFARFTPLHAWDSLLPR